MAKQYTGIDGSLYLNNARVARVADWSLESSVETLEITSLGDFAKDYVYGVQSFSGSATLFYYENASNAIEGGGLLGDVWRTTQTPTDPTHVLELRLTGGSKTRYVKFKVALTQVTISAAAGEIIQAQASFNVCGALQAAVVS